MLKLAPVAFVTSLLAALLSASVWLSFVGAALGLVAAGMGALALRAARRRQRRSWLAVAAVVLGTLAALALPFFLVACNEGLSCV